MIYLQKPYKLGDPGTTTTIRMGRTTISLAVKNSFMRRARISCFMPEINKEKATPCMASPERLLEILSSVPIASFSPMSSNKDIVLHDSPTNRVPAVQGLPPIEIDPQVHEPLNEDCHLQISGNGELEAHPQIAVNAVVNEASSAYIENSELSHRVGEEANNQNISENSKNNSFHGIEANDSAVSDQNNISSFMI